MLVTLTSDTWTSKINWSNMFTCISISSDIFIFILIVRFTSVPTIDAIRKSFSNSFPGHFPVLCEIKFVECSIILPPDTDLMLTLQYLRPEWGKGAISQDAQVTILDLPKAHGIPYMEVSSLQPCTLQYFIISKLPCITADGNFQSYLLSRRGGKGILFLSPGVLFGSISKV